MCNLLLDNKTLLRPRISHTMDHRETPDIPPPFILSLLLILFVYLKVKAQRAMDAGVKIVDVSWVFACQQVLEFMFCIIYSKMGI